ncbi:MAG: hypothetical protein KC620_23400, partial [Myxococcales bacterium]|nr:hypothetical protein [Myxococcales bacterium]
MSRRRPVPPLLPALAWMVALPLLWGPGLASFLLLDPLATAAVYRNGALAGLLTLALAAWRLRHRLRSGSGGEAAFLASRDLTLIIAVAAVVRWGIERADPAVPYFEAFS